MESLEQSRDDRVIYRVIICGGQSPEDMDQLMVGDGTKPFFLNFVSKSHHIGKVEPS